MKAALNLNTVTRIFTSECHRIFGDKLCDVKLFGSFARNDFDDESDIDMMVLVDMESKQLRSHLREVCAVAADLDLEYDVFVSPMLQNIDIYESARKAPGFYNNVERDGISLYER